MAQEEGSLGSRRYQRPFRRLGRIEFREKATPHTSCKIVAWLVASLLQICVEKTIVSSTLSEVGRVCVPEGCSPWAREGQVVLARERVLINGVTAGDSADAI